MGVPQNHPFRLGFSIVNHPFGGTVYGNPHILFTSNLGEWYALQSPHPRSIESGETIINYS
jgi:hypothetical protein